MKYLKKILCVFLTLLCLVGIFPISSAASTQLAINGSRIEDDFKAWGIDLSLFPKNADNTGIYLMHMLEYGYDDKGNFVNYGIYLYFYNPSGKAIENSDLNKVQMAILDANGNQLKYDKYDLVMLDYSTSNGYENVFYKFRVKNALTLAPKLSKSKRQYKISGAEFLRGDRTADGFAPEYALDSHYMWTGYQAYYNKLRTVKSTLYYERKDMDVIKTKLFPATWYSLTSDKGKNFKYELFSVYFAVDNYFIRKYGNPADVTSGLREVRGEYLPYVVSGFFTSNDEYYNNFKNCVGTNLSLFYGGRYSGLCKYGFANQMPAGLDLPVMLEFSNNWYYPFECTYNLASGNRTPLLVKDGILIDKYAMSANRIDCLNMVVKSDVQYMSSDDFKAAWTNDGRDGIRTKDPVSFEITTSDGNLNNAIHSFASSHEDVNILWKFFHKDLWVDESGYPDILPIVQVDKSDISWMNDEALGNKYFMNNESTQEFKSVVRDNL